MKIVVYDHESLSDDVLRLRITMACRQESGIFFFFFKVFEMQVGILYKTNVFHFPVGLYSDKVQKTSKRDNNVGRASHLRLLASFFVL